MQVLASRAPRVDVFDGRGMLGWVQQQRDGGATDAEIDGKYGSALFNAPLPRIPVDARDAEARAAVRQVHRATAFMRTMLGRDGWDDDGGSVALAIRAPRPDGSAATIGAWSPFDSRRQLVIGIGNAGETTRSIAFDDDVIAHELGHGIWFDDVNHGAGIDRQPSQMAMALSESFGDIVACAIDDADWTIGESTGRASAAYPGYLRDLEHPTVGHMDDVDAAVRADQHALSGVASLAAVRTAARLGRTEVARAWLGAIPEFALDSDFATFAGLMVDQVRRAHGIAEADRAASDWRSVGVEPLSPSGDAGGA